MEGNNTYSIPNELVEAIKKPYGYSFLIKGSAGTGKTTLVLELLSISKNPFYFSTRVSPTSLESQFPWIKECIKPENILDVTQLPVFVSIDLDSEDYFENLIKFKSLPEFLQIIYHRTKDLKQPFIAIDAWDMLLKYLETPYVIEGKIESFLSEMVRQKHIKLFLITETEKDTYLDYIVDGILTLRRVNFGRRFGKKRVRELHIEKLRGVEIKQHEYLFTLNNGRFNHFEPHIPEIKRGVFNKIPDPKDKFSTGNVKLDECLGGGYQKGSFIVLEIDDVISDIFTKALVYQTIFNFIKNGRTSAIIPGGGENTSKYIRELSSVISENEFNEQIRIFEEEHELFQTKKPFITVVSGSKLMEDFNVFKNTVMKLKQKSFDNHLVQFFAGLDTLERRYTFDKYMNIQNENIETVRILKDLIFVLIRKSSKAYQIALNQCDYHFSFTRINGCVILEIIKPFFKYPLALEVDFPKINLIPII
ncbi:MAG: gas vesicle protein GvpD P-loop domain-containing protein [Candidatus Helarchaeota archaeon]